MLVFMQFYVTFFVKSEKNHGLILALTEDHQSSKSNNHVSPSTCLFPAQPPPHFWQLANLNMTALFICFENFIIPTELLYTYTFKIHQIQVKLRSLLVQCKWKNTKVSNAALRHPSSVVQLTCQCQWRLIRVCETTLEPDSRPFS